VLCCAVLCQATDVQRSGMEEGLARALPLAAGLPLPRPPRQNTTAFLYHTISFISAEPAVMMMRHIMRGPTSPSRRRETRSHQNTEIDTDISSKMFELRRGTPPFEPNVPN
jgi:hypothetical protein